MTEKILPDLNTLIRMKEQGLTDAEVGAHYGVTPQAVNKALTIGGYYTQAVSKLLITEVIPWSVKRTSEPGSHHSTYLGKAVMSYLRVALGDERATPGHRIAAKRLRNKLHKLHKVVDYDAVDGFKLVDRVPKDGNLLFRWPAGKPLPEGDLLDVITLEQE